MAVNRLIERTGPSRDKLTKTQAQRLAKNPGECPKCESISVSGGPYESDEQGQVIQDCMCGECLFTWVTTYRLVSVEPQ